MPGLYIHIPFCKSRCHYCDFASSAGRENMIPAYLEALGREARLRAGSGTDTLYIGGGTPSLLSPADLTRLFSIIKRNFSPVNGFKEATIEANPESVTHTKANLLRAAGVNRVSLGLQASQDRLLKKLGRPALFADFLKAFACLRRAGFDNINIDLMTGLPGQSRGDFSRSLQAALELEPEHISFYALEVHEGTVFARWGVAEEPDKAAEMYEAALPVLKKAGFRHYEISNFARPGKESLHNLNYWEQGDYIGLGAAAASHEAGRRWNNIPDPGVYIKTAGGPRGPERANSETLTPRQRRAERIWLGLRKTDGIVLPDDIFIEFKEEIGALSARGLLEVSGRRIKLKETALYLSNEVFRQFV
ncbi:MAG: hypothetical protein A3J79_10415 [Elusimicrobia bacterium RIFOXYB2_FULL_62_6]|nr:MAG: hypothetical protein A3J79_10415 [Elusimicrobia bacterium RIFOXYB2_FULL_62_6]